MLVVYNEIVTWRCTVNSFNIYYSIYSERYILSPADYRIFMKQLRTIKHKFLYIKGFSRQYTIGKARCCLIQKVTVVYIAVILYFTFCCLIINVFDDNDKFDASRFYKIWIIFFTVSSTVCNLWGFSFFLLSALYQCHHKFGALNV